MTTKSPTPAERIASIKEHAYKQSQTDLRWLGCPPFEVELYYLTMHLEAAYVRLDDYAEI